MYKEKPKGLGVHFLSFLSASLHIGELKQAFVSETLHGKNKFEKKRSNKSVIS